MNARYVGSYLVLVASLLATGAWADSLQPPVSALRERLDLDGLMLAPEGELSGVSGGINPDALLEALGNPTTAVDYAFLDDSGLMNARAGVKRIALDEYEGRVRVDDDRGYSSKESIPLPDAEYVERAQPVLQALGVFPHEMLFMVRDLVRRAMPEGGGPVTKSVMARKLLVERTIGGLPVIGDRLVLSFAVDGTLRKIHGRWRAIDLDASTFQTRLSTAEVVDLALEAIEKEGASQRLSITRQESIRVHTRLVPFELGGGWYAVRLMARIDVPTTSPTGVIYHGIDVALP